MEDPLAGGVPPVVLLVSSPILIVIIIIFFNLLIPLGVIILCLFFELFFKSVLDSTLVIPELFHQLFDAASILQWEKVLLSPVAGVKLNVRSRL